MNVLKSPLLHFFVLGGAIFAAYALLDDAPPPPEQDVIRLSPQEAARLVAEFRSVRERPPTPPELSGLMRGWAMEEASVREALALGLDKGDPMIRQRLSLKMLMLAESAAAAATPDDATLEAFLEAHRDRFAAPAQLAFAQVTLTPEMEAELPALRAALAAGADPAAIGGPSLLPALTPATTAPAIDGIFGRGFAERLAALPRDAWAGPVESVYGRHLVRVTALVPAATPPLSAIRARVEDAWRADQARLLREAYGEELLRRHEVVLPPVREVLAR